MVWKLSLEGLCELHAQLGYSKIREGLNESDRDDLDKRANTLKAHSSQSHFDEVSESTWEADVRSDVFGKVRDDPRLRMFVS